MISKHCVGDTPRDIESARDQLDSLPPTWSGINKEKDRSTAVDVAFRCRAQFDHARWEYRVSRAKRFLSEVGVVSLQPTFVGCAKKSLGLLAIGGYEGHLKERMRLPAVVLGTGHHTPLELEVGLEALGLIEQRELVPAASPRLLGIFLPLSLRQKRGVDSATRIDAVAGTIRRASHYPCDIRHKGAPMDLLDEFKKHAGECRKMAKHARTPSDRETWQHMAERWARCAEVVARDGIASGTDPVSLHRHRKRAPGWLHH